MYRQQIAKKTSPSRNSTSINQQNVPSPSYASLSGTIQRAAASPETLRDDEWLQLDSAIGTRATNEIKSGKRTSYVPEFKGISAQFQGNSGQVDAPIQKKDDVGVSEVQAENKTGLPDNLKAGVENLSGFSLDDVKVHYNSPKPAQLQAHAYTQGTDIHVASGQEKHLPHETWHVVQQMQRRVKPTLQVKGVAINDRSQLEKEADLMGSKAKQTNINDAPIEQVMRESANLGTGVVQAVRVTEDILRELFTEYKVFEKTVRFKTLPKTGILVNRILAALKKSWSEDEVKEMVTTSEFAWAFQQAATAASGETGVEIKNVVDSLKKSGTKPEAAGTSSTNSDSRWTLRHYSSDIFDELRTNLDLVNRNDIDPERSNTRSKDYAYGTPSFTFFLIAINGKIPHRGFLANNKYYYEINLDDINEEIWIGGDIINAKKGDERITYKGTGGEIKQFLLEEGIKSVEDLDWMFGEQFEVKYPGNIRTSKEKWKNK